MRLTNLLHREPVRVWLYGLLAPVLALLVAYGLLSDGEAQLWFLVAAAALGTPVAVERARARVSPVGKAGTSDG